MEKLNGNETITVFNDSGNDYISIITREGNNFTKKIYNSDLNEVMETPSMISSQSENGKVLEYKEKKTFVKEYNRYVKETEKAESKNIKQDLKYKEYKDMDAEQLDKLFEENGIKEGSVYSVNVSNKDGSENTTAFFEVYRSKKDNTLRLKPYNKDAAFKSNGNLFFKANADLLKGASALALISDDFAEKKIYATYRDNNPDIDFQTEKLNFSKTDITKLALKSIENNKKEKVKALKERKTDSENETDFNATINKVPSAIEDIYENKGRKINPDIYTSKMFDIFKKLSEIPPEDRNINNLEKKIFGPVLKKLSENKNDLNEQKKIFSQWVFDNNGKQTMDNAGLLFEKSLNDNFKGWRIKRNSYDEKERDENVEAILNDSLPIMKDHKNVDYIYDPETRSLYKGNTQMALQRNNELQDYKTDTYVSSDNMIKNNLDTVKKGMRVKYEVCNIGKDNMGRDHFQILVPCKPSWSERRAARKKEKKEKELRKEEYRRNKADAKYLYKYGELPEYKTALQPLPANQPPLAQPLDIKNPYPKPDKDSSIQDKLNYEFANYFKSMFTKEPFVRGTDWLDKENKKELLEFAKTKPELFRSMYDACYNQISVQVRQANRSNEDVNQIIKAVTDVQDRSEVNVKENTHTHKRGRK